MNKRTIKFRLHDSDRGITSVFTLSKLIGTTFRRGKFQFRGRYTGLLDKNGKEIYEGDVVRLGSLLVGEVKFDEGEFALFCTVRGAPWRDSLITSIEYREIIGNIYENSDLLKNIIPQFIK